MRKYAQQYRQLPQGEYAQDSDECGNENLSLALSLIINGAQMKYVNQSHFGHLNHELSRLNTSTRAYARESSFSRHEQRREIRRPTGPSLSVALGPAVAGSLCFVRGCGPESYCGHENLSLEVSRIVDGTPREYANQSHFGRRNHDLLRLNTLARGQIPSAVAALAAYPEKTRVRRDERLTFSNVRQSLSR
jgi:hypothetical protein